MSGEILPLRAPQLAQILEQRVCAAIVAVTPDGAVSFWNRGAELLFGARAEQALGRPVADIASIPSPQLRSALDRAREAGCTSFDTSVADPQGQRKAVVAWLDAILDDHGQLAFVLTTWREARPRGRRSSGEKYASPLDALTPRQLHILELIAQGNSTREIARRIGRSAKTVEAHRANIMKRLGERNLAGLMRLAIREGLGGDEVADFASA